jgi:putative ABC transport system ATP-binding protein
VAIARALVTNPDLVVADEPTGELDTETGKQVLQRFREVATERNTAVVIASHDEPTLAIADRLVRMRDGQITDIESQNEGNTTPDNPATWKETPTDAGIEEVSES